MDLEKSPTSSTSSRGAKGHYDAALGPFAMIVETSANRFLNARMHGRQAMPQQVLQPWPGVRPVTWIVSKGPGYLLKWSRTAEASRPAALRPNSVSIPYQKTGRPSKRTAGQVSGRMSDGDRKASDEIVTVTGSELGQRRQPSPALAWDRNRIEPVGGLREDGQSGAGEWDGVAYFPAFGDVVVLAPTKRGGPAPANLGAAALDLQRHGLLQDP